MFERDVCLQKFGDRIVAFVDVQLEPGPRLATACDLDSRGESATVVTAGTIPGYQGGHQPVGQASLGLLVGPGHLLSLIHI